MIISKTPFRISFFGGGTDYPAWYDKEGGLVLSTTINKYCYITIRELPNFFDYNYRLRYFKTEEVNSIDEIQHPSIRESTKFLGVEKKFELVHFAEMPAQSGLGSSSTFTVGLLHALHAINNNMVGRNRLMSEAIHVEQNLIKENVGSQDQAAAAYGGLNIFEFKTSGTVRAKPITIHKNRSIELDDNLLLFFTGFSRTASSIAGEQIRNISVKYNELRQMMELTKEANSILVNPARPLDDFGDLLNEQWRIKKTLSNRITNRAIDNIYEAAIAAGALGGKLLGAGSGGFMLLYVKPENQNKVKKVLSKLLFCDFNFECEGSSIVHYSDH